MNNEEIRIWEKDYLPVSNSSVGQVLQFAIYILHFTFSLFALFAGRLCLRRIIHQGSALSPE